MIREHRRSRSRSSVGSSDDSAREDIEADRLWKARDRLASAVRHAPADQEVLSLLGEVHHRMGDLPAAGRFWILTERSGFDVDAAMAAFEDRWGSSLAEKLRAIPVGERVDAYPATVRERIQAVASARLARAVHGARVRSRAPAARSTASASHCRTPGGSRSGRRRGLWAGAGRASPSRPALLGHDGAYGGYQAEAWHDPRRGLTIVALVSLEEADDVEQGAAERRWRAAERVVAGAGEWRRCGG